MVDSRMAGLSYRQLDGRLVALLERHGLRERHVLHGQPLQTLERLAETEQYRLEAALEAARRALASVGIAVETTAAE